MSKSFYLVFDTETNGLPIDNKTENYKDFSNIYLYQIAYYKYDVNLNPVSKINLFVDLDDYKNFVFIEKNGITEKTLRTKGKKIKKILLFLSKTLNDVHLLIAHNLDFDINVLLTEAKRNNNMELYDKLLSIPKFDTMRQAGCLGLKLIRWAFPSQEDVYNLLINGQAPEKKRKKIKPLTFEELENNQTGGQKKELYKTLHDADDDTKHCGDIFRVLIKRWNENKIKFGRYKSLNFGFDNMHKNFEFWALKTYYSDLKEFKDSNLSHNIDYRQTYFRDYLNYIKFKYPDYVKNINTVESRIKKEMRDFIVYDDDYEDY